METKRLIIVAVGGQGNLLASKVLGEAALLAEIPVRMSEIHGMAQRGGVVESAANAHGADAPAQSTVDRRAGGTGATARGVAHQPTKQRSKPVELV